MMPSTFPSASYINTLGSSFILRLFFNRSFQIFIFLAHWEIFLDPFPPIPSLFSIPTDHFCSLSIPVVPSSMQGSRRKSRINYQMEKRIHLQWNREAAAKWQTELRRKSLIQNQPFDSFSTLIFLWRTIKTRTLLFSFCLLYFKSACFCSSSIFFYLCHLSAPQSSTEKRWLYFFFFFASILDFQGSESPRWELSLPVTFLILPPCWSEVVLNWLSVTGVHAVKTELWSKI